MNELSKALVLENVSYRYKSNWGGPSRPALNNVSLTLHRGEMFGFLGQSGAGKTTTLKCILNLLKPSSGSITIFDQPHYLTQSRERIGYLPERPYFYDHLIVKEFLEMCGRLSGISEGRMKSNVNECLEKVQLQDKARAPLHTLSKGQTQKIAMAQALISQPELLILDEPFSGLDPLGRKQFKDLLFEMKCQGATILVSSHILEDIQNLCDRVSIMADGTIRRSFSLSELAQYSTGTFELVLRTKDAEAYGGKRTQLPGESRFILTFSREDDAKRALSAALSNSDIVEAYRIVQPTLEELFVETVQK